MADPLDLLALDEAKHALKIDLTDNRKDDVLPRYITAVSRFLDQRVGPTVAREVTESHDGGDCEIKLRHRPVHAVTSVTEYRGGTGSLVPASSAAAPVHGYMAEPYAPDPTLLNGVLVRTSGTTDTRWAHGRQNVTVVYEAGRYEDTASVDDRFKQAAAICLINMWRDQQQSAGGFGEFDVPTAAFPTFALPKAVADMLADELWYQRPAQVW